jgi:formylmethanofuran dehydrogenase subunit B
VTAPDRVQLLTCLGCGCGCDDIAVTVRDGKIVEASPVCPIEQTWLGDGSVPWEVLREGRPVAFQEALTEAAVVLEEPNSRTLVYLGPDVTSQAQRQAVALADLLRATLDTATSDAAANGLLAAQRRGRATATLGEVRNRSDVLVFWGVDPRHRYPRYLSRYAVDPAGTHVPQGRAGRFVISVTIGADTGPSDADLAVTLDPAEEITALSLMRAAVAGHPPRELSPRLTQAVALVPRLTAARYVVLVHDAEPTAEPRNPLRAEALIALALALNGPTRAALSSLRAGGNRPGAESVLTWQTGYPFAVDYSLGHPRYRPGERGLDRLIAGGFTAALLVGSSAVGDKAAMALGRIRTVAIGPRASEAMFKPRVAIDTGVAGIHEEGTAYRMDEVPLSLRPPLPGARSAAETLLALTILLQTRLPSRRA